MPKGAGYGSGKHNSPAPHETAENDPYHYQGGASRPDELSGDKASGTFDPPGKIGGYAESVPGTKDPAYAIPSGPSQSFDTGVQGTDEKGVAFGAYKDKPVARGPTDFSKEDSNRGNP